jgi:hypothetical protein
MASRDCFVDHFWASYIFAIFSVVRDRIVHVSDTAFEHQGQQSISARASTRSTPFLVHSLLQPKFRSPFSPIQPRHRTKNGLLAEQVGFSFVFEGGFDDTGTTTAHA